MKNLKTIAIALLVAVSFSANAQEKKINVEKSQINWVGKKVTGQHSGTIDFQSGTLVFKKGDLVGGNFTVDMNSIAVTDLKAGEGKEKLEGHLKADDFFGTEKHPTAKLVIKTIGKQSNNLYSVTADLTIKGITNSVKFKITVNKDTANAALTVDRTKFDVKYGSGSIFDGLGDKAIDDNFELAIDLKF
jgi:polyisoprenoid-binding protein YceI